MVPTWTGRGYTRVTTCGCELGVATAGSTTRLKRARNRAIAATTGGPRRKTISALPTPRKVSHANEVTAEKRAKSESPWEALIPDGPPQPAPPRSNTDQRKTPAAAPYM